MGLTLNSSSLTLEAAGGGGGGAAAAGLSEADVNTLIKAKTDWTLIESLDAAGANVISLENILDGTYKTVKIEGVDLRGNYWMYLRLRTAQGLETSNYGYSYNEGRSTSGAYRGGTSSYVPFLHDSSIDHAKNFEIVLSGIDGTAKPTGRFHSGHGNSTYDGSYTVGWFVYNASRAVTGFQFQTNTSTVSSGYIKVYGLN